MTAALDLAARGLGDTIARAPSVLAARGFPQLAAQRRVRPADVRDVRVHHPPRRPSLARHARVHGRWPSGGQASRRSRLSARIGSAHGRARDRRRRGVPPDHLLAARGGAADDGREHRARDAALGADGARDGRPPGARRLHHPRRRQGDLLHRRRARARRGDRPPPPADRALPDRRARRSRGTTCTRRPSGSSTRCRPCSRRACWPRSATRRRARTAIRSSRATRIEGVPLGDVEPGAKVTVLRFENEAEDLLHLFKDEGLEPGPARARRRASTTST